MPGLGIRIWNPPGKGLGAENPLTSINTFVADPIGLNGTTIPFKMTVGNVLVRIVGRANAASRPLGISVKWQGRALSSQGFYAESGAGGCFVGFWTIIGQLPETGNIVISCGAQEAGCAAIRCGEIGGVPAVTWTLGKAGYSLPRVLSPVSAILVAGGCADETASPFTSPDLDTQYAIQIPKNTQLPNRHNGLSAYFGLSYLPAADGVYDIVPKVSVPGVIGGLEIKL
jgi:hypothetical protein